MNQICKVCGEPAAGYHFGAFTCEGCKSFFGRTYNNPSTIGECKNNSQCVINKKNRTSCKSCRLKKCLKVGMSKTGSRYGRRSNWFKLHCIMDSQTNLTGTNTNGSIQISDSFNENKDLVNQIKSEANNSRDVNNHKSPTTNGINNNNNINTNKSNKNSSTTNNNNNNNNNLNGNCNNHTLHNITNHSNVLTCNGNNRQSNNANNHDHVSPGTNTSNGPSPTTATNEGLGRVNLPSYQIFEAAKAALAFSAFDPTNSLMLHHQHSDSKTGLKLLNAAAAAAAVQASSSKSNHLHHHSPFFHPLNASSSSSSSPPIIPSGQSSQVNLSTPAIGSTIATSLSNSSSPNVTSNGRVDTPNSNLSFPFHHHSHHQFGSHQSQHPTHHGIPISPIAPLSPLDPSSRLLFQSAAQLFGKGFNVLPKEFNNAIQHIAYNSRFFPIGSINQVAKLTSSSSSLSLSPSPHLFNLKGTPPSPSDIIYEQERPIDLSRKSSNIKPSKSKSNKQQPVGSEDEEEEEDPEEEDEDAELCLHDDNNNPTGDEGSKNCMIGDHDSGFSPSSNEDNNVVTTPLDLTAKKSPTPPPSAPPSMTLP